MSLAAAILCRSLKLAIDRLLAMSIRYAPGQGLLQPPSSMSLVDWSEDLSLPVVTARLEPRFAGWMPLWEASAAPALKAFPPSH